jgi:hypothetical protein
MGWVRDMLPAWAIVLSISAVVGGASAVISVVAYRDLVNKESPISVPSKSNEQID